MRIDVREEDPDGFAADTSSDVGLFPDSSAGFARPAPNLDLIGMTGRKRGFDDPGDFVDVGVAVTGVYIDSCEPILRPGVYGDMGFCDDRDPRYAVRRELMNQHLIQLEIPAFTGITQGFPYGRSGVGIAGFP